MKPYHSQTTCTKLTVVFAGSYGSSSSPWTSPSLSPAVTPAASRAPSAGHFEQVSAPPAIGFASRLDAAFNSDIHVPGLTAPPEVSTPTPGTSGGSTGKLLLERSDPMHLVECTRSSAFWLQGARASYSVSVVVQRTRAKHMHQVHPKDHPSPHRTQTSHRQGCRMVHTHPHHQTRCPLQGGNLPPSGLHFLCHIRPLRNP